MLTAIQEKVRRLPQEPGVYLMKDARGTIIYVGKAKSLRDRVQHYFFEATQHTPKVVALVAQIEDLDFIVTANEVEALLLECNLIKSHKPRYNIRLRDDKMYPYLRIDSAHEFPTITMTRRLRKDGAKYLGPFVASQQMRTLLEWAKKTFQIRDCSDHEFRNRSRPCLLYQMGQCSAPCVGYIDEKSYGEALETVVRLLDGRARDVMVDIEKAMFQASQNEDYEKAAHLRDLLKSIHDVTQSQGVHDPELNRNLDALDVAMGQGLACVSLVTVRHGQVLGALKFLIQDLHETVSSTDVLREFIPRHYLELDSKLLPDEILLPEVLSSDDRKELQILTSALSKRVEFHYPQRGGLMTFLDLARRNAESGLLDELKTKSSLEADLQDVQLKLGLARLPQTMECYDISHFQGSGTVASQVVFKRGMPEKGMYRHYHVREVDGPDDFASLREVLRRRFDPGGHGELIFPDLVVIDGGKGQLAQAQLVFKELGIDSMSGGPELVSIAKARTQRGFQEKKVEASSERIFKPGQKNPILLKSHSGAYRLMTRLRDESHRFAIEFHRKVRKKKIFEG